MRLTKLLPAAILVPAAVLAVLSSALCSAACAQAAITPFGLDQGQTPPLEVGFGYSYVHANAPPAACGTDGTAFKAGFRSACCLEP